MSDLIKIYQSQIVELSRNYSIFGTPEAIKVYGLGLCEEVGEVLGLLKRYYRGDAYEKEECGEFKYKLCKELGDVTAYLALVLETFGFEFNNAVTTASVDLVVNFSDNTYYNGLNLSREVGLIANQLVEFELNGANMYPSELFHRSVALIYFLTSIAEDFGLNLEDVLETNLSKINKMVDNKTLLGTGDDR